MVERSVFGADHGHFGEALCEQWKFPRSLAVACAHHHDPMAGPAESRQVAWLIFVAERLATEQGGFRTDLKDRGIPREACESLGISEANLAAVRAQLGEKLAEAQATLSA
jgi:HD-like signal output (HDOD) protein